RPRPPALPSVAATRPGPLPSAPSPTPLRPSPSPRAATTPRPAVADATDAVVPPAAAGNPGLDRAEELYGRGRYAAALAEAKAVLRREPGNADARSLVEDIEQDMVVETRLKQAREALRRGDREAALEQVRAGLAVKGA